MNKIGKRSFYKALDNLSGYCMGFQAIFALAVGIFFYDLFTFFERKF